MTDPSNFEGAVLCLMSSRCSCVLWCQPECGESSCCSQLTLFILSLLEETWWDHNQRWHGFRISSEVIYNFMQATAADNCIGQLWQFTESPDVSGQELDVSPNSLWMMIFHIRQCHLSASCVFTDSATVTEIMKCDVQDFVLKTTTTTKCLHIGSFLSAEIYCNWKELGRC